MMHRVPTSGPGMQFTHSGQLESAFVLDSSMGAAAVDVAAGAADSPHSDTGIGADGCPCSTH